MPILKRDDPLVALKRFDENLLPPHPQKMWEDSQGMGWPMIQAYTNYDCYRTYQATAQLNVSRVLRTTGMPLILGFAGSAENATTGAIFNRAIDAMKTNVLTALDEGFIEVFGSIPNAINDLKSAVDKLPKQLLDMLVAAASQIIDAVVNLAGSIPIAGWIIKLVYGLVKGIIWVVKGVKKQREYGQVPPSGRIVVYNPDVDATLLRRVEGTVDGTGRDWTDLFLPPADWADDLWNSSTGVERFHVKRLEYPKGWKRVKAGDHVGLVPGGRFGNDGMPLIHGGMQINEHGNFISDTGNVMYSCAVQQLAWLWNFVMGRQDQPSPALYTVDADLLELRWRNYIWYLQEFLTTTDKLSYKERNSILQAYKPVFGWKPQRLEYSDTEDYIPVKQAKRLKKRQIYFLKYSLCAAYVDERYPALKSLAVKTTWANSRHLLLSHDERCEVDLANVPDPKYREELRSNRGPSVCNPKRLVANGGARPLPPGRPWRRPGVPKNDPKPVPPPPRGADGLMAPKKTPTKTASDGTSKLVVGALAGAAAFTAYHKRDELRRAARKLKP